MTIKTIIEEFEKKINIRVDKGGFTYLYEGRDELDREEIKTFLHSRLSTLLDEIESKMPEIQHLKWCSVTVNDYCDCGANRVTSYKKTLRATLNKYRV